MNYKKNDPCPCGSDKKYKRCCLVSKTTPSNLPSPTELAPLIVLYNGGRFVELATHVETSLSRYPQSGFLWKLLGAAKIRLNKNSLSAFRQAAALLPDDAESHYNLGLALKTQNALTEAVDSYRTALSINPNYAEAHANLGNTLSMLGKFDEAIANLRSALKIRPDSADEHNSLGVTLRSLGQLVQAVASYEHAIRINANFLNAHYNLANTLRDLGKFKAAINSYRKTVRLKPDFIDAHNNLALTLQEDGQFEAAMASYQQVLAINPVDFSAYNNMGTLFKQSWQFEEAAENFRRALSINPDFPAAWSNLGAALKELGETEESINCFRRALEINPRFSTTHSSLLYNLNIAENPSLSDCLAEASQYGRMATSKVRQRFSTWQCPDKPDRLRVGLVSGNLHTHAVGFFLDNLLATIDLSQIELIAYPTHHQTDKLTERMKPYFSAWHPLFGLSDEAAAKCIHTDGVHVLIDLSGHTDRNRLPVFAWKPAPVQASWLGYFATTGIAEMDYVLADKTSVPESLRKQFTEDIWHLPDTKQCLTAPAINLDVISLPALKNGYITFGSFQRLDKIGDNVLATWAKILAALPNARLKLATELLGNPLSRTRFTQRLQQHNLDLDRISMSGAVADRKEYLARYNEIDITLDTFPYGGTTTTCEALWMGVPTLTLTGETFLSRFAASVVMAAGMPDWIAESEVDYITKAIKYSRELETLARLRSNLREQVLSSPVFDTPRFARNFEAALWGMWQARKLQQQPQR
jgi:predicted O-linked N-acetylglucosamine transferase (SPINDLY family)